MTNHSALHQSLAASCAAVVMFIGICHEFVGSTVYPWGPAYFGGPLVWHGIGAFTTVCGALAFAGTVRAIRFPVVLFGWLAAAAGTLIVAIAAVVHGQFHFFALSTAVCGGGGALFHRKSLVAEQSRRSQVATPTAPS